MGDTGYLDVATSLATTLWIVLGALGAALAVLMVFAVLRRLVCIAEPHQVLIVSGKRSVAPDGTPLGYTIVRRGRRVIRIPILHQVDAMDMRLIPTDVVVQNAYSKGNIPLRIHAIANVKINGDDRFINNAIERFQGRPVVEIQNVARQTLEGALREVVAQMTPEEVNEDRLKFADRLAVIAEDGLQKLGLQLDTLKIQSVADDTGYLDALGRPRIAQVLRDAENAENQAQQEITRAQARAHQRAESARADNEKLILQKRNELRRIQAELEGQAQAVEREAEAAARTARAQAEQQLQALRAELERLRLQADVVIPAEIEREAAELRAVGEAAPTQQNGAAAVAALRMMVDAWKAMGPRAKQVYVIQHLEQIVGTLVAALRHVRVGEVHVVDRGDGSALAGYVATYPQMIAAVLRAFGQATGIDVPAALAEGAAVEAHRGRAATGTHPTQGG
ncbi:MAG: SPFH domain-containing protein [Myxococcota bacterium]|nr:SPFH domain-containing protein [Myxococcota bacterium]